MVERTNVNDLHFPEDWILNEDYKRDVNADELAIRDLSQDVYGSGPVIFEGLTLETGTNPNTLKINAGRARDVDHRHVVLAVDVDNIADNVNPEGENYVAITHDWAYSGLRAAVKTGTAYQAVRADDYQIHVGPDPYQEGEGYIRLGLAVGVAGAWTFKYDTTSRSVDMVPLQMRNGFSLLCPGQTLTDAWEDFGDQRFMRASWDWADKFIHVILAENSATGATHLYTPQINTFVDFGVPPNTPIDIGNLTVSGGGSVLVQLGYQNPYIKIKKTGQETTDAFGIIHYCGGPYLAAP